ncbi:MAG TPA: hypothetical protein VFM82_06990 [Flavobacteriaceae bacterium]|nr:hypothetical protein [Flavobacteriaceae bacterium]
MKNLVLLIVALICLGCSVDDDTRTTFTYELVPTIAVQIPDTLVYQNTYNFEITFERPTQCHFFEGFNYEKDGNQRLIGVINGIFDNPECEPLDNVTAVANLNFIAERNDFYIFKFWQGENENGEPIFLTKEVPVKVQ